MFQNDLGKKVMHVHKGARQNYLCIFILTF
jgi:hypothetical protein